MANVPKYFYFRVHANKTSIEIEDASDADVVEVVRCKDCKWFNKIGCAIEIMDESDKPHEDDFCSFAERKDGEQNDDVGHIE